MQSVFVQSMACALSFHTNMNWCRHQWQFNATRCMMLRIRPEKHGCCLTAYSIQHTGSRMLPEHHHRSIATTLRHYFLPFFFAGPFLAVHFSPFHHMNVFSLGAAGFGFCTSTTIGPILATVFSFTGANNSWSPQSLPS